MTKSDRREIFSATARSDRIRFSFRLIGILILDERREEQNKINRTSQSCLESHKILVVSLFATAPNAKDTKWVLSLKSEFAVNRSRFQGCVAPEAMLGWKHENFVKVQKAQKIVAHLALKRTLSVPIPLCASSMAC